VRKLAAEFMILAEKQGAVIPLLVGHRLTGISSTWAGDIVEGQMHLDQVITLYHPVEHRGLATRFGHDAGVAGLVYRAFALWFLDHPKAALEDANNAVQECAGNWSGGHTDVRSKQRHVVANLLRQL
jgi:hypothetical protein